MRREAKRRWAMQRFYFARWRAEARRWVPWQATLLWLHIEIELCMACHTVQYAKEVQRAVPCAQAHRGAQAAGAAGCKPQGLQGGRRGSAQGRLLATIAASVCVFHQSACSIYLRLWLFHRLPCRTYRRLLDQWHPMSHK